MAHNKCIPLTLLAFFGQGSVKGITLKLYKQRILYVWLLLKIKDIINNFLAQVKFFGFLTQCLPQFSLGDF